MLLMVAMLMADGDHLCEVQIDAQHLGQPNDLADIQKPALVVVDFVEHLAGLLLQGLGRTCPQRYCWHLEECNPDASNIVPAYFPWLPSLSGLKSSA